MKNVEDYRRLISDYWLLVRQYCQAKEVTEKFVKDANEFGSRHGEDDPFMLDLLKAFVDEVERNVKNGR